MSSKKETKSTCSGCGEDVLNHKPMAQRLLYIPQKILCHHEIEALPQIIMHDLGHKEHLDLNRATFLIDNPDFDFLRGVAGFCKDECKFHKSDLWEDPCSFHQDMSEAVFHKNMKCFLLNSN